MTTAQPKESSPHEPEQDAKKKAADTPTRDDVHEQREPVQPREGVVRQPGNAGR